MPKKIFQIFFIILLFSLKSTICEEKRSKLILDEISSGKINKDNSFDFFELDLPNNIPEKNLLVFTVKENKIKVSNDEELFSDPDVYISKTAFPKNKEESDWFSERFGNDIVTITFKELNEINKLYISLYCERKCKYNLKSYITKEIELKLGQINSITLSKHNSIHYFLKIKWDN